MAPSIWLFPLKVWYDRHFYAGIAKRGKGIAILPLLATAVFLAFVWGVSTGLTTWLQLQEPAVAEIVDQIPELRIRNGSVTSPVEQPWVLEETDELGRRVFVGLDTTGQINALPEDVDMGILVTEHQIEVLQQDGRHQTTNVSEFEGFELNPEIAWSWITAFFSIGIPVAASLSAVWTVIVRLVIALMVGGLITAATSDRGVDYTGGLRVAILGMVPSMVLFGLIEATGLLSAWWLIAWLLSLAACAIWWALAVVGIRGDDGRGQAGTLAEHGDHLASEWAPPAG